MPWVPLRFAGWLWASAVFAAGQPPSPPPQTETRAANTASATATWTIRPEAGMTAANLRRHVVGLGVWVAGVPGPNGTEVTVIRDDARLSLTLF